MEDYLKQFSIYNDLLLFPVRLETHFAKRGSETLLRIRIIPDEIQLQYEVDMLTKSDLEEGRRFWIRWYIASGDAEREFEEWRLFCVKHGVNNACRIVALTRPEKVDSFRYKMGEKKQEDFLKRPYARLDKDNKLVDLTACCQAIYEELAKVHISENAVPSKDLTVDAADAFFKISNTLSTISNVLGGHPYVVDYLYDKVNECLSYLAQRVESIHNFYERYPQFQSDVAPGELVDNDFFNFSKLESVLLQLRTDLSQRARTLDDMVQLLLSDATLLESFFGNKNHLTPLASNSYPTPKMPALPNRFIASLKGTVDGKPFEKTIEGRDIVQNDIQICVDLQSEASGFSVDKNGKVSVPPALKWMVDYDEAFHKGMAVTVPLGKGNSFHIDSLYVYGVNHANNANSIDKLFKSHVYWKNNFTLLKSGIPTNQVDESKPVETLSDEELIREKYRLEILEEGLHASEHTDGRKLSTLLKSSYENIFARTLNTENTELEDSKTANAALWDYFEAKMISPDYPKNKNAKSTDNFFIYLREFFLNYVNTRGVAPMFRIDDQPYGIVPISDFDSFQLFTNKDPRIQYIQFLHSAVVAVEKRWREICERDRISSEGMTSSQSEKKFLQMVSQNPHSVRFDKRFFYYGPRNDCDNGISKGIVYSSNFLKMLSGMGLNDPVPVADTLTKYDVGTLIKVVKDRLPAIEDSKAQRLVGEFMDTFTHRPDIWYTAILSWVNNNKTRFLYAGSYGWVFNLSFSSGNTSQLKGEYLLAPSIQHAMTGAVLRSAYLQTKKDAKDSHMSINLSSMRARQALRMIDGIKQGMSTGMILGADLERYLHDAHKIYKEEMDLLIYPLRKLFPLTVDIKAENKDSQAYSLQVINGEYLLNTFLADWGNNGRISTWLETNAGSLNWFKDLVLDFEQQAKDNKEKKGESLFTRSKQLVLFKLIERMADSYDALNDLLLAEGVHRLVAGDKASFAAIANFMSKGSGNLPSPAVLDTPVDYAVLAHKVGLALPRITQENDSLLLKADPAVGAWIAAQMGSLDKVVFYVDYTNGKEHSSKKMCLSDSGLTAMEFLYLSSFPKVLAQTLEILWREKDWENRKLGQVRILTGDPAELEDGERLPTDGKEMLLYEFSLLTDNLSSLLGNARTMRPGDIVPSLAGSDEEDGLVNVEELKKRYESVYKQIQQYQAGMDSFMAEIKDQALTAQYIATAYGWVRECTLAGLVNESVAYDTALILEGIDPVVQRPLYDKILERQQKFIGQLKAISEALQERLKSAAAIADPGNAAILAVSAYTEAMQTLTLKNLKITCRFSVSGKTLPKEVNPATKLGDNAFLDWFEEISEVRPDMKLFHELSMLQQMEGESALDRKKGIFQVQSQGKVVNEWLGCQVSDESLLDDTDSLVLFERQDFDEKTDNAGLVFDSWLEYIPFRKQTAGLVYRCDIPDAEAPQALLYAIHPFMFTKDDTLNCWKKDILYSVFQSAETLLKARTVDPDQMYAHQETGLLGSLLTARTKDLFTIDPNLSLTEQGKQQTAQLDAARKTDLVMDVGKIDKEIKNHISEL